MKKVILILLCCAMLGSTVSCNSNDDLSGLDGLDFESIGTSDSTGTTEVAESPVSGTDDEKSKNETVSESEIIDSISLNLEDNIQADVTYSNYNFINEKIGYSFIFGIKSGEHQLLSLMKTDDGGKNWSAQLMNTVPSAHWLEKFICAKMLDENVGFIAVGHYADDNVSRRTYISTDGGVNWEQVVLPPNDYYTKGDSSEISTYMWSGEAYDLVYKNGQYVLYFKLKGEEPIYFQYFSTDLKTWTYVE